MINRNQAPNPHTTTLSRYGYVCGRISKLECQLDDVTRLSSAARASDYDQWKDKAVEELLALREERLVLFEWLKADYARACARASTVNEFAEFWNKET